MLERGDPAGNHLHRGAPRDRQRIAELLVSRQPAAEPARGRIGQLDPSIAALARQLNRIQADIDAKTAELDKLQVELASARIRLGQLETFEAHAQQVLARQLVATYETHTPNILSVVIEATGFQDLLNRLAFMQRVRKQDASVVSQVRAARRAVAAQATRLGKLEVRQQSITMEVVAQRNQLAQTSASLQQQRSAVAQFRSAKASELAGARRGRPPPARAVPAPGGPGRAGPATGRPVGVELQPVAIGLCVSAEPRLRSGLGGRVHVPAAQERRGTAQRMVA